MHKLDERGSLILPLIVSVALLVGALGFGYWSYAGRQDYKDNVDKKIAEAVAETTTKISAEKDAEYTEKEKSPYQTYQGPVTYGSAVITYPKSWSAYVDESGGGGTVVSGYFHPGYVPATDSDTSFAFRFEIVNSAYDSVLKSFDSSIKSGRLKASAYRAPKVESVLGSRLEGTISSNEQGILVLLPLRDKTIKLWTESDQFASDFTTILDSFTFVP
jgi:hypothetical protein